MALLLAVIDQRRVVGDARRALLVVGELTRLARREDHPRSVDTSEFAGGHIKQSRVWKRFESGTVFG